MKIIVFSDSHRCLFNMREVMSRNFSDTDLVIHLGDGSDDCEAVMSDYPYVPSVMISGNGEEYLHGFMHLPNSLEEQLILDGCKILATHGHKYGVKWSDYQLEKRGIQFGADVVLYGHTHRAEVKKVILESGKTMYMMNPGTIGASQEASYGIVKIAGGSVTVTTVKI